MKNNWCPMQWCAGTASCQSIGTPEGPFVRCNLCGSEWSSHHDYRQAQRWVRTEVES